MTVKAITDRLERTPFEAFRICVSNADSYEVTNPHMVAFLKSRRFVAIPDSDRSAYVPYLHITSRITQGPRPQAAPA